MPAAVTRKARRGERRESVQLGDGSRSLAARSRAPVDAWPRVRFVNDTRYGIVVWVSGPCAREVVLPPSGEHEAEVCEGSYEVAAQVDARGIVPLVGESTEFMDGYAYTYTIFVTSGGRRRRAGPR